jgi:hypothetical protein
MCDKCANHFNDGNEKCSKRSSAAMIPNRSCRAFYHGEVADLILIPTKVPFANCHSEDYFTHSENELPRPKEAEK